MSIFKSSNPVLTDKAFKQSTESYQSDGLVMTERGTLNKFFLLSLLVIAAASLTWKSFFDGNATGTFGWMIAGAIGGFICALGLIFKPKWGPVLAPVYALLEGAFIGGASAIYQYRFEKIAPGFITQAVALTFGIAIAMFVLYRFQIIKVTEQFKSIVVSATLGLVFFYGIVFLLRIFNIDVPFLHEGSTLGIVFSLLVIGLAAMNLVLAFDRVQTGVAMGAPKYMEWYSAFGLILVLIWLYLEVLNLLSKLNSRN